MIASSLFASLHYLALAMGLGGLFMRGKYLRALIAGDPRDRALDGLFGADNFWGIAAVLWLVTGLARVFGHLEKGSGFYLHSPLFWLKMGLFVTVGLLEIFPMTTFLCWRIERKRGVELIRWPRLQTLRQVNDLQLAFVLLIPFVASAMARGIGMK